MADTTPSQDPLRLAETLERMRPEFCGNQATLLEAAAMLREQHAALAAPQPNAALLEGICTCAAADMHFGVCCKVRRAFEGWYDEQKDGRLQPFDVWTAGVRWARKTSVQPNAALADGWKRKPLTLAQMEAGRESIFSTSNPFCPCDSKTFRKVAEWVERHHRIAAAPPTLNASKEG
ncbi:hypothetical protein [Acidovorax sp. FG27]|uniref:hypothetical protein n=1 Tax=Acidovorax sp. FG27 TaxID=3133652 RepID=UPI0030E91262